MEHLLVYIYDESGSPIGLKYRNNTYSSTAYDCFFFEKNLQGDIIAVYNSTGEKIGTYTYDAWGDFTIAYAAGTTYAEQIIVSHYNPFRYRGYYYDIDLGWYYLQSRYYNPETGRFLNADGYVSTGTGLLGYNAFSYCNNNPVMMIDPEGMLPTIPLLVIVVVVVIVAVPGVKTIVDTVIDNSVTNDAEKELAKQDYYAAYQVYRAKTLTEKYIDKTYGLENDTDDTQVNAYRHAMWNAIMTDKIGETKAKMFADAHEQNPNNPVDKMEMDLHNNALGRRIAKEYAGQGYDVFSEKIIEAINNGEAKVIKWDSNVN